MAIPFEVNRLIPSAIAFAALLAAFHVQAADTARERRRIADLECIDRWEESNATPTVRFAGAPIRPDMLVAPVADGIRVRRGTAVRRDVSGRLPPEALARRLAEKGLLVVLTEMVSELGLRDGTNTLGTSTRALVEAGFPVDLVRHFRLPGETNLLSAVLRDPRLDAASSAEFAFQSSQAGYVVAAEDGSSSPSLVRAQFGGGYRDGLIRGSGFDVTGAVIGALPDAAFVVSVPMEMADGVIPFVEKFWPLKRRGHVLALIENLNPVLSPWTQDNAKAGAVRGRPAVLVPRVATEGEINTKPLPEDTAVVDSLPAAGIRLVRSPLLFQGGNVFAVAAGGRRHIYVGEAEIVRHGRLGLNRRQTIEAYRSEFGAEKSSVLPNVSYHIDVDVSLRVTGGRRLAFVNDPMAAARRVLTLASEALGKTGPAAGAKAGMLKEALAGDQFKAVPRLWRELVQAQPDRDSAIRSLRGDASDEPALNFDLCEIAADWIAALHGDGPAEPPGERARYLVALKGLDVGAGELREALRQEGWTLVAVPGFPDVWRLGSWLNCIHTDTLTLVPLRGGFFRSIDDEVLGIFRKELGLGIRVNGIVATDFLANHGGLHCAFSLFNEETPRP